MLSHLLDDLHDCTDFRSMLPSVPPERDQLLGINLRMNVTATACTRNPYLSPSLVFYDSHWSTRLHFTVSLS